MKQGRIVSIAITLVLFCAIWGGSSLANQKILVDDDILYNQGFPTPDGSTVVYSKGSYPKDTQLWAYNINSGSRIRLNAKGSILYLDTVAIGTSNRYACWLDSRNAIKTSQAGLFDIYISDIKTGLEKRLTKQTAGYWNLTINGSWVCWVGVTGKTGVYAKNIDTDDEPVMVGAIPKGTTTKYEFFTWNGKPYIVWQSATTTGIDIRLFDLREGKDVAVAGSDNIELSPVHHWGGIYFTECDSTSKIASNYLRASGRMKSYDIKTGKTSTVMEFKKGRLAFPVQSSENSNTIILSTQNSGYSSILAFDTGNLTAKEIACGELLTYSSQSLENNNFLLSERGKPGIFTQVKLISIYANLIINLSSPDRFAFHARLANNTAIWTEYPPSGQNFRLSLWAYRH